MIPEMLRRAWGNTGRTSSAALWLKVQVLGLYIWKKSFWRSQFVCFKDGLRKASSQWSSGRPGQEPRWGPSSASQDWYQPPAIETDTPLIPFPFPFIGVHSSSISLLLRVRYLYPMLSFVSLCASNCQKIRYREQSTAVAQEIRRRVAWLQKGCRSASNLCLACALLRPSGPWVRWCPCCCELRTSSLWRDVTSFV